MTLNYLITNSLEKILKECDVVKLSPISNEYGEVVKIIIEYEPKIQKS